MTTAAGGAPALAAPTAGRAGAPLRAWRYWLGRGAWALGDQGLFATSNFVVNVSLARHLPEREYGAFVLAYGAFQVLGQVHLGLLGEPLQVFGAAKHPDRLPAYLRTLLRAHWAVTGVGAALLAAAGGVLAEAGYVLPGRAMLALAASAPFMLLAWLGRSACYVRLRPELAAGVGALNIVCVVGGLWLLGTRGLLSVPGAFAVMAVAGLVSGAALFARLGVLRRGADARGRDGVHTWADVARDHWRYGRWATASGLLMTWLPNEFFYFALTAHHGLELTASLKAMTNLVMPVMQAQYALANVLLPTLVRARGTPAMRRALGAALLATCGGAAAYWLVLGASAGPLVRLVYGGRYVADAWLLWPLGALPVLAGAASMLAVALRARERPADVFKAATVAGAASVGAALLAPRWGVGGVAVARLLCMALLLATLWLMVARSGRDAEYGDAGRRGEAAP